MKKLGYLYLAMLSALFVSITNIPYYIVAFSQNNLAEFLAVLFTNLVFTSLVFSFFTFSRSLYFVANLFILCLNSGGAYFKAVYAISLSREAVESIFHANVKEIGSNFDHRIWLWGTMIGIIPSIVAFFISKSVPKSLKNWITSVLIYLSVVIIYIFLSLGFAWHIKFYEKSLRSFMPYNYIVSLTQYLKSRSHFQTEKTNPYTSEKNNYQDLIVVLIIGESARADHFSLNGYYRNTNPKLATIDNLISFKHTYALATYTIGGVQGILKHNIQANDYSLIKLMEQNNFKTFWFSNQRYENDIVTSIAKESSLSLFRDRVLADNPILNHDEVLIPYVKEAISKSENENLFIVLHTLGSHYSYDLRYPDEFMIFTPTCKEEHSFFGREHCVDRNKVVNAYDNSIRYTDHFIHNIITLLKNKNALVIYVSDHGESLGENGIFFHTADYSLAPKEQLHIPFLLWGSDQLLKNSKIKANLEIAKSNTNLKIDQNNIYHSIPHCLGLEKNSNPKRSICSTLLNDK